MEPPEKRRRQPKPTPPNATSWDLEHWPPGVYPHSPSRARYLLRMHRNELLVAGALARVGRELVVLGPRYTKWLEKRAAFVPDFEIVPNKKRRDAAGGA
jgi:hypothetical protein